MADAQLTYGTSTGLTKTLASLASDVNLLVGRTIAAIDNTSTKALDYLVRFSVTLGTSPTANRAVEIWAAPSEDGTVYAGGNGGTDAGKTHTQESKDQMTLVGAYRTPATTGFVVEVVVSSLAGLLGGNMPRKCSFWVVHSTGVALNTTEGNHVVTHTSIKPGTP